MCYIIHSRSHIAQDNNIQSRQQPFITQGLSVMDGHLSTFLNLDGIPWRRGQLYYIFYSLNSGGFFFVFVYKIKGPTPWRFQWK